LAREAQNNPLARSKLTAQSSIKRLRNQALDLKGQQFPGGHIGPYKWLSVVIGLLDTAESYLEKADAAQNALGASNLTRDATDLAATAYECLSIMRGSGLDELPFPIVRPLQRWFRDLGINNTTLFRAEILANYELLPIDDVHAFRGIRNKAPSLQNALNNIEWPFLRVTVPSKAFSIIPHMAIVAHEIGHAAFDDVAWDLSGFDDEKTKVGDRIAKRLGVTTLDSDTRSAFVEIFSNWFEELSADAFSFYLTGPASFFALSEFLTLMGGSYGLSKSHPANSLRRKILHDKLISGGTKSFSSVFKKHTSCEITEDFNSSLLVHPPSADHVYDDFLKHSANRSVAAVIAELNSSMIRAAACIYDSLDAYLKNKCPEIIYKPANLDADLDCHLDALLAAIPPIESGSNLEDREPASFAAILNVGWAALLTKLPDLRVKVSEPAAVHKLERLHGLLLKAVELSEARRAWKSV